MKRAYAHILFAVIVGGLLFEAISMALDEQTDHGPSSVDVLVKSFDDINFTRGNRREKRTTLDKWTQQSITFGMSDTAPAHVSERIASHLSLLAKLTGRQLIFQPTSDGDRPDVVIRYLEPTEAYEQVVSQFSRNPQSLSRYLLSGRCRVYLWNKKSGEIEKGLVLIVPNDDTRAENTCIIEELTQVLGLSADKALYLPSIFSEEGLPQKLSINDQIVIHTLYDPRLKAGQPREEALVVAKQVIEELLAAYERSGVEALFQR